METARNLQALDEISDQRSLQIVFLTAFDEYALEAFNVAALDYLLKPVSPRAILGGDGTRARRLKTQPRARAALHTPILVNGEGRYFLPSIPFVT